MQSEKQERKQSAEPFLIEQAINPSLSQESPQQHHKGSFYSRFEIPPNLQFCKLHQTATSFGLNNQTEDVKCRCCNENTKQPLPFNCPISEIYKINEPVGFYYTFIKMMLITLLFMIIFPGIYSIVQIALYCQGDEVNCDYIYGVPVPKLKAYYTQISLLLSAAMLLMQYIVIAFLFYWNVFIHEKMRLYHKKASDQHVFLTGLDHSVVHRQRLMDEFREYSIQEVIYTHRIGRYLKLFAEKYKIQALKQKLEREGNANKINRLNARLRKIDNEIIPIKNKIELGDEAFLRTDKVFIRFANGHAKNRFEEQYKRGLASNIYNGLCGRSHLQIEQCNLYLQSLGDPREIIWQNLEVSSLRRYLYIFMNNILLVLILTGSYYFIVQLNYEEEQSQLNSDIFLSISVSLSIEVVNFILSAIIDFTTEKEGRYTVTGLTSAVLLKKILVYFINTTLIPFSMFILKSFRPIEEDQMRNIFTLFLFCNLISPVVGEVLQIGLLVKLYKRHRIQKLGKRCIQTQISANKIFEKVDFNLEERYGLICQRMMNCVFYAAIFPVGAIVTALGLGITYALSKYQLLNNCAVPRHSFRLGKLVTQISALFPCIYGIGYVVNLIVYQQNPTYDILYSIIMAACAGLLSLAFILFGNSFMRNRVKISLNDISKIYVNEEVTYKDLNPTSFMGNVGQGSQSSVSLLKNLMQFSVFREGMNFSRLSRTTFSSRCRDLKEYNQ